jgi:hypothetical protein
MVMSNQKHQPPATSTESRENKVPVKKKPTPERLSTDARKEQVQPSTTIRELTEFEIIMLQKAYLNKLTTRDMILQDGHILEYATELSDAIQDSSLEEAEMVLEEGNEKKVVDSSVEEAHMGSVAQVLEERNKKKVVEDTDVSEDKDVKICPLAVSSVTTSSKNETTTKETSPKTYKSCNDEGRATTSTSISITSNINLDGFDRTTNTTTAKNGAVKTEKFQTSYNPANQLYVDLSIESGSSVSITAEPPSEASGSLSVGSPSDLSLSLSPFHQSDSESVSIKPPNRSDSFSSSENSATSSSSSDSESY